MPPLYACSCHRWQEMCERSHVLAFIDILLRGAGQVMFQNSPLTGLFFLAGIFWGAYAAHTPDVARGAVVGLLCGTLAAYAFKAVSADIAAGLHGYNGILVGCALPTFFAPTPLLWLYVVLGAGFSTIMMCTLSRFLRTWQVSAMTAPFVLTTWMFMLAAYSFAHLHISALPHPALSMQPTAVYPLTLEEFCHACFTGVSQVFLINNVVTGVLFLLGLACASLWAAAFALGGSALAAGAALLLGASSPSIIGGLYQFSAVLTAIGLGTAFYKPGRAVVVYAVCGVLFTVVAQGGLNVVLNVYGIPTLTFPFVLAAWIFLLPHRQFSQGASAPA